jgi:hypothetical protein
MEFRPGRDVLKPGMTAHPILYHATLEQLGYAGVELPRVAPDFFLKLWGDDKSTRRIKTWGHDGDKLSAHWISTRGGTPMHVDPGYARYAVQMQLYNQGFVLVGVGDSISRMPLFTPGLVTILDTHSPHQVTRDPRLPNTGNSKLAVAVDSVEMPDPLQALPAILEKIRRWAN